MIQNVLLPKNCDKYEKIKKKILNSYRMNFVFGAEVSFYKKKHQTLLESFVDELNLFG